MIRSTSWAYRRAWTDLKHMTLPPSANFTYTLFETSNLICALAPFWCLLICCSSFHYTSSSCRYFTGAHVRLKLTHRCVLPYLCLLEDDVDLEALVNDMDSSLESLYSSCSGPQTESTPLLHNGQTSTSHSHHHQAHQHNQPRQGQHSHGISHISPEPPSSSSDSPQTGLRRSQPMHINAVR